MDTFKFDEFFPKKEFLDVSKNDNETKKAKALSDTFTEFVHNMRQNKSLPNPAINELMALFWDLVGNYITPTAITDAVPSLSFWAEKNGDRDLGVILCPFSWLDQVKKDPYYQMGALVFVASQAKDYWNRRFIVDTIEEIKQRAFSNEAEFLNFLKAVCPEFKPNDYQKEVLEKYPQGIASCGHYKSRPFDLQSGPPFPMPKS